MRLIVNLQAAQPFHPLGVAVVGMLLVRSIRRPVQKLTDATIAELDAAAAAKEKEILG